MASTFQFYQLMFYKNCHIHFLLLVGSALFTATPGPDANKGLDDPLLLLLLGKDNTAAKDSPRITLCVTTV